MSQPSSSSQSSFVTPESFYSAVMSDGNLNQPAGEGWAWHANWHLPYFVRAYRAWQDTAWLDAGVKYYDYLVSRLQRGPDGYMGWIGPYIYDNTQWADVHVGDAILSNGLLSFAELVLANVELRATYGEKARCYVSLIEEHLFEKWDERGTWYEHGQFGGYFSWNKYLNPGDLSEWHQRDHIRNSNLSLPFNKNNQMGAAALRLYRITGNTSYRDKAMKIFATLKSRLQLHGDTYVWNYWEPLVPWDISVEAHSTRHWVNVHPTRNYQAGEVALMVEAYHSGIVFTDEDVRRLVRTNLNVMWNQDLHEPRFRNSNAGIWPGNLPASNTTGTLWTALAYFDQTIRDLMRFGSDARGLIDRAFYENVIMVEPPGYRRLLCDGESHVVDCQFGNVRYLHMALVVPSVVGVGIEAFIGTKSLQSGELIIDLLSADGETQIERLYRGHIGGSTDGRLGMFMLGWNGTDRGGNSLPAGNYRIRWTLEDDGYREFPIMVVS